MKRRLVTAIYWFVLGANALFWLTVVTDQSHLDETILPTVLMLVPFGILPIIRWLVTGRWYVDPR
jgi:hypothetical protein